MLNFLIPIVPYFVSVILIIIIFIVTKDLMSVLKDKILISKRYMDEKLRDATINRYAPMLDYGKVQVLKEVNYKYPESLWKMFKDINIGFDSTFCIYCSIYNVTHIYCKNCPLGISPNKCCKGLWVKMAYSQTWEEWIKGCKKLIIYIKRHGV